jgi:hypothetical protein
MIIEVLKCEAIVSRWLYGSGLLNEIHIGVCQEEGKTISHEEAAG